MTARAAGPVRPAASLSRHADAVLIELYRTERDREAMRALVERHHDPIRRRLRRELRDDAEAEACSERLWIEVARRLDDYRDEGEFPRWLSTIATALIEERRAVDAPEPGPGPVGDGLVDRLVRELIPALPVDQRTAWLLRHESALRDPEHRLEWTHLAELNGVDVADAWSLFESARGRLIGGARSASSTALDEQEMLVFLVWTEAQRAAGPERVSWGYLGELLGVPAATMEARYRAARERLTGALEEPPEA